MELATDQSLSTTYSVEVSGWDHSDIFFVERSQLHWTEESGKQLTLTHQISPGAMVFVRLLQPIDDERAFPVAYEVELVSTAAERPQQFRLKRAMPRSFAKEEA
jgi:hypothetical protein